MADAQERREPESAKMRSAIQDIIQERGYQAARWGRDHDQAHTPQNWITILTVWVGKVASCVHPYTDRPGTKGKDESLRKRLVQLAAICVAAIEALDQE